jgi:hypothetical protein
MLLLYFKMYVNLFHRHKLVQQPVQLYFKCVQLKYSYNPTGAGEIISSVGVSKNIEGIKILRL